ncbi:nucleotide exchange factor GrpE [soil metagenome]
MTNAANDPEHGAASEEAAPQPDGADDSVVEGQDEPSTAGDQPDDAPDDVSALIEAAQRERDTYLDHLRRERAEFENFRKRSTRERTEALDRGAEALIAQLLGVLDNFGYVLEAAKDADDAVAKGVRMIHGELRDVLTKAGLEDVPGVGSVFDPTWHDAVMQVEGDTTDDGDPTVAQVLRTGYRFKGRVLRPASVAVTQ